MTKHDKDKISPGAQLAALRPSEEKTCPEPGCDKVFTALRHASSTCRKCRDKLRKRAKKLELQRLNTNLVEHDK